MCFAYEQLASLENAPIPANRARFALMPWFESVGGEDILRGPVASIGFITEF